MPLTAVSEEPYFASFLPSAGVSRKSGSVVFAFRFVQDLDEVKQLNLVMARNDGHACAQRLVNKQQFYQTSMLKFIGVTLAK